MAYKLLVLFLTALLTSPSFSAEANLSWTEPTQNEDGSPLTDLTSYEIHYGCTQSGVYGSVEYLNAPATAYTVLGLPDNGACYFAAKAVNSEGTASAYSNEATRVFGSLEVPGVVTDTAIIWRESPVMALAFVSATTSGKNTSTAGPQDVDMPATRPDGGGYVVVAGKDGESAFDGGTVLTSFNVLANEVQGAGGSSAGLVADRIGSSEPATYTLDYSGSETTRFAVLHYSGIHATDFTGVLSAKNTGASDTAQAPAITATDANSVILRIYIIDTDTIDSFSTGSARVNYSSGSGSGHVTIGVAEEASPGASTTTGTATAALSASDDWQAYTLEILPPAAGGGAPENFLTLLGVGH